MQTFEEVYKVTPIKIRWRLWASVLGKKNTYTQSCCNRKKFSREEATVTHRGNSFFRARWRWGRPEADYMQFFATVYTFPRRSQLQHRKHKQRTMGSILFYLYIRNFERFTFFGKRLFDNIRASSNHNKSHYIILLLLKGRSKFKQLI